MTYEPFKGKVIRGKGQAKLKGFPTANLILEHPLDSEMVGLWVGVVQIDTYSKYYGICNIVNERLVEIHIKEFDGDIYGEEIEFIPAQRLNTTGNMASDIQQLRTCDNCRYCISNEYGYSAWTVMGYTSECARDLRQDFEDELSVDQLFAVNCPKFCQGRPNIVRLKE